MSGIITKKIDDFFKSQFQIFKLNYLLELSNHDQYQNQREFKDFQEVDQNQKQMQQGNQNKKQSSSNNSGEIDSNSGSNSDLKKEDGSSAVSDNPKNKEEKQKLPRYASNILREWFSDHINDPYPTKGEKIMLASKTNLSLRQVSKTEFFLRSQIANWFVNHRGRKWKERKQKLQFSNQIKTKLMIEGLNQMLTQQNQTNNLQGMILPSTLSQSTKVSLRQSNQAPNLNKLTSFKRHNHSSKIRQNSLANRDESGVALGKQQSNYI